ncbi:hypothetical protein OBBRIDRAFT_804820 [Obba rivulosa]|uniref:CxC2-like cysteine cluster KDZ transposase-associated domain-containing protein n=1 Tax=Obba rivulosa TaxID=1052685 RepID=A0A8E2ARY0_9APHY|nr:hypothetical protein OBBRIDRAFT_804820 [Obba rivulosa]
MAALLTRYSNSTPFHQQHGAYFGSTSLQESAARLQDNSCELATPWGQARKLKSNELKSNEDRRGEKMQGLNDSKDAEMFAVIPAPGDDLQEAVKVGESKSQPPKPSMPRSSCLAQFVERWARRALDMWLTHEQLPSHHTCQRCNQNVNTAYRCKECFQLPLSCSSCIVMDHQSNPFHRIRTWDASQGFWDKQSLSELGLTLNLGHNGRKCLVALGELRRMTFMHSYGINDLGVCFCTCLDNELEGMPDALQLIAVGMWPASWDKPMSAFTIDVMKQFHLLSLQSQIPCTNKSQDHYRELLRAMQEFIWIWAMKRAGQEPARRMTPRCLGILCPTCPQPGINMDPQGMPRPAHLRTRYLDALYHTVDGNFHQNQHEKPLDPDDFALLEGAGYFADMQDLATFQKQLGPLEKEPSTCHKFGAMEYGGYGGRVSGTVGLSCARHMFVLPGGGVDLQKGERFANVDFAMISGLQRWMPLLLHISGYDINCQYRKNFEKRMEWFRTYQGSLRSIAHVKFPKMLSVIGKFHLPAHNSSCRYKFSYYWMPGAAMTDGEAPECIWAVLNGLAARTREMAAGHRHDIINDHHSDMNTREARDLAAKHKVAKRECEAVREEVNKIEAQVADETLREWKRDEEVYLRDVVDLKTHPNLKNPYELDKGTVLSQKQVLANLNQQAGGERTVERHGLIGVLQEGIELQELRLSICHELTESSTSETLSDEVKVKVERFRSRLDVWRELHDLYLRHHIASAWTEAATGPDSREELSSERPCRDDDVDAWIGGSQAEEQATLKAIRIELPSDLESNVMHTESMKVAVEIERQLREGQAQDALAEVRVHLITKYSLSQKKRKEPGSQAAMTRSRQNLKRKGEAVERAAEVYRRARVAVLALSRTAEDCKLRELRASDLVAFMVRDEDRMLGDSQKSSSWIWEDCSWVKMSEDRDIKNFVKNALRVHWFRRHALCARWSEETLLLEEEMRRTLRFFWYWLQLWLKKGESEEGLERPGHAAYARWQAYRYQRLLGDAVKRFAGKYAIASWEFEGNAFAPQMHPTSDVHPYSPRMVYADVCIRATQMHLCNLDASALQMHPTSDVHSYGPRMVHADASVIVDRRRYILEHPIVIQDTSGNVKSLGPEVEWKSEARDSSPQNVLLSLFWFGLVATQKNHDDGIALIFDYLDFEVYDPIVLCRRPTGASEAGCLCARPSLPLRPADERDAYKGNRANRTLFGLNTIFARRMPSDYVAVYTLLNANGSQRCTGLYTAAGLHYTCPGRLRDSTTIRKTTPHLDDLGQDLQDREDSKTTILPKPSRVSWQDG